MVLDTSALIAILRNEPERDNFLAKIDACAQCVLSASTLVEAVVVMRTKQRDDGVRALFGLLELFSIEVVPFDNDQALIAAQANREYGKGEQNRAKLNFGDCFSYALSKYLGQPLLFKGDDFLWTDVEKA